MGYETNLNIIKKKLEINEFLNPLCILRSQLKDQNT